MKEALLAMKIGDRIKFDYWDVWRVPGGWIFAMGTVVAYSGTFVPYDNGIGQ